MNILSISHISYTRNVSSITRRQDTRRNVCKSGLCLIRSHIEEHFLGKERDPVLVVLHVLFQFDGRDRGNSIVSVDQQVAA